MPRRVTKEMRLRYQEMLTQQDRAKRKKARLSQVRVFKRQYVANLLGITRRDTYQLFPVEQTAGGDIAEGALLDYLNRNRVASPYELLGEELAVLVRDTDAAKEGAIIVNGKPASLRYIRGLCRRKHNPPPHFRIGANRVRFYPGALGWWASQINSGTYVNQRRYHYGDQAM